MSAFGPFLEQLFGKTARKEVKTVQKTIPKWAWRTNERTDGRTDGRTDRRTDGRTWRTDAHQIFWTLYTKALRAIITGRSPKRVKVKLGRCWDEDPGSQPRLVLSSSDSYRENHSNVEPINIHRKRSKITWNRFKTPNIPWNPIGKIHHLFDHEFCCLQHWARSVPCKESAIAEKE